MQATISPEGVLIVWPETKNEQYQLDTWALKNNKLHDFPNMMVHGDIPEVNESAPGPFNPLGVGGML